MNTRRNCFACRIAKNHATAGTGVLGNTGESGGEDAFSNFTRPF